MIATRIVEVLLNPEERVWAYRSVTMVDFIAIRRSGIYPKHHSTIGLYPRPGSKTAHCDNVIWFADSYDDCRSYNDQLTIRFPWPADTEDVGGDEFVSFTPVPPSAVEVEIDTTGEWVPIRKATLRQSMVVKR